MASEERDDVSKSIADSPPIPPRDDLVKTAAKFLQSPKVYKSPLDMKIAFLKKKGLSEAEIDLAIKMSEEMLLSQAARAQPLVPQSHQVGIEMPMYPPPWPPQSRWARYRDIANTVALLGGLAYAVYWFYKKYVVPYLFGLGRKSLETRIIDLEKQMGNSLTEIKTNVMVLKEDIKSITERKGDSVNKQIEELKTEITSLKKLLLNRKQFPSASVTGPVSIPAWQRASSPPGEKETEEEGNGSGTNGSDSSLEMIKE